MRKVTSLRSVCVCILSFLLLGCPDVPKTISVASVSLDKTAVVITKGELIQLTAIISPADAVNQTVSWTSSDTNAASVSSTGLVTGISKGSATITVTTADGNKTASCTVTVEDVVISVTSVALNKSTASISKGLTDQLKAEVLPSNATNKNVVWSSSNSMIASVSSSGLVTGVSEGSTTVTVTTEDGNKTASCTITITSPVPVSSVSLDKETLSLDISQTAQLTASILPETAYNKAVSWTSSNPSVATVSSTGLVTGVSEGEASVTVTTEDGSKTDTCSITVSGTQFIAVTSVSLDLSSFTIDKDAERQLTAAISPADATIKTVTWSSNNNSIATVSNTGLVKGVADGTAVITVTSNDGNKTAQCSVTVQQGVVNVISVSLNWENLPISKNTSYGIAVSFYPSDATNKKVTWTSNNPAVVSVSNTGVVTGVAVGTAVITVTTEDGNKTAECQVTVSEPEILVTSVSLNTNSAQMKTGEQLQFTASVLPENATNKTVIWESSDDSTAVVVRGLVTAKKAGTVTIKAMRDSWSSVYDECEIAITDTIIPVDRLFLSCNNLNLIPGGTAQLSASVLPVNATNQTVSWTSSNSSVAAVSSTGLVTAVAAGSAEITVSSEDGNITDKCTVKVEESGVAIVFEGPADENIDLTFNNSYLLSKSSDNDVIISLSGTWDSAEWYVDNYWSGYGTSVSLYIPILNLGNHTITVIVNKNDIPYSKSVTIKVIE